MNRSRKIPSAAPQSSREAAEEAVALTKEQGALWETRRRHTIPCEAESEPEAADQLVRSSNGKSSSD